MANSLTSISKIAIIPQSKALTLLNSDRKLQSKVA